MIKPLNNNCLIEVIDEYAGVIRNTADENVQKGILQGANFFSEHLTASTGFHIEGMDEVKDQYKDLLGKVVYWQEYADAGSKFDIAGKKYVLVPFYRLIGFDDETTKESK